jgi:hypothetical protein
MPLLPLLVSPEALRDALGDERVHVFDANALSPEAFRGKGPRCLQPPEPHPR